MEQVDRCAHKESTFIECSCSGVQNEVFCLLWSMEVDCDDTDSLNSICHLRDGRRRSFVFCSTCGLFKFGRVLTPKEKRQQKWLDDEYGWQHTAGVLNEKKIFILSRLASVRFTRAFELVARITDKGALNFSLYVKDRAVSTEKITFDERESADVKAVMVLFFPNVAPCYCAKKQELREKEDIDGFLKHLCHKVPKSWEICSKSIVAVLRPYQEEAVRFMISCEDPDQQIFVSIKNDFIVLPTTPPILYSPISGAMSRHLEKPSYCKFPPGGILADEMGLGKTVEVISLILNHQRGKELPKIGVRHVEQCDTVKTVLNELVSTIVAAIDGYSALQNEIGLKRRSMFYYNNLESTNRKRQKGECGSTVPLTITCPECDTVCSQERVHWDRFPSRDISYLCPECIQAQGRVYPVKGTLIIAPSTICHQWYEELKRHIRDDIKIDMYRGLVNDGYKHPEYLATQDIVICSFETLRSEIYFVEVRPRLDSLRRTKRHRIAPTPLLAVEWWRICIDEAQMVESTVSAVAAMCEGLKAVNRWCVTGTPITNSLQDLYGLVRFLRIVPFVNECWWRNALIEPYRSGDEEALIVLFSKIMWRNTKNTVADQMFSPPKSSDLTVLRFTPIEEQFYRETLSNCRMKVRCLPHLHNLNAPISSLHGKDFEKLMEPLQSLRKFIVFPGLRFQEAKQHFSTEENLQEELFRISTQHVEVHQRNILMYHSGLAGLEWLCGRKADAAKYYSGAIRAMKELEEANCKLGLKEWKGPYRQLKSDKLQQIHIFTAILDLLKDGVQVDGVTLEEAEAKLNLAYSGYTEQVISNLQLAYVATSDASPKYKTILSKVKSSIGWLCEAANLVTNAGLQHVFIDAVRTALDNVALPSLPATNLNGLNLFVVSRWDELVECATKMLLETEQMAGNNILEDKWAHVLEQIIACDFAPRDGERHKRRCALCVFNKCISQLESFLFIKGSNLKTSNTERDDDKGTSGEQKISSLEVILRTFLGTLIRTQREVKYDLIEQGKETMTQLEEFKVLLALGKRLYAAASEYAAKIDEIRQCKLRMQYATNEEVSKFGFHLPINLIIRGTEDNKRHTDLNALEFEVLKQTRCLAKLRYLTNLRTQQTHDCPVCLTTIKDAWIVYPCAHCLCVHCFNRLTRRSGGVNGQHDTLLKCSLCRASAFLSQISYVQSGTFERSTHLLDVPNVQLKRSISVKVDAIMRRIRSIRIRDPTSKTLLFTSLSMLINPLCRVMSENDISFCNFLGTNRQKVLADFRLKPEIEVLIMPMSSGARGLNLTAANNIIFVEPQMDVSQIAQAIGRIDRIGQKKAITIHHFTVYGSIEEQIYYKYSQDYKKDWTVGSIFHMLGLADSEPICDE